MVLRKLHLILGLIVIVGGFVMYNALFIVQQTEQALVLQFGEYRRMEQDPGLKIKVPFIQNVIFYDKRVLQADPPAEQLILGDQKRLVVDTFTRFRIDDPLRFYQAVNNEFQARSRLSDIIISALRRVLGNVTLAKLLSEDRDDIMRQISARVDLEAENLGIDVIDVRIRRADLPAETSQAIYNRITSEREREAREFRARGAEEAQRIRSAADRERTVLVAEAENEAQQIRGEGDALAVRIYAESFGADPEFFAFYRSMEAYRNSMNSGDTTMVLSPDSDFFQFFKSMDGGLPSAPSAGGPEATTFQAQ
ncbi:MAG: protease modulator HflC [Rhodospirillaceae bacterium]